jgi:hypothetical protein
MSAKKEPASAATENGPTQKRAIDSVSAPDPAVKPEPRYDTREAAAAQIAYCHPQFAPGRSGRCYRCGRDIYQRKEWPDGHVTGISVEAAGNELITGCPHCHYSFCD